MHAKVCVDDANVVDDGGDDADGVDDVLMMC